MRCDNPKKHAKKMRRRLSRLLWPTV